MSEAVIEISINTGNAAEDAAVERLLETLDAEDAIRRTLQAARVTRPVMLALTVVGDAEIQALNKQHRQQDKPTDVLSFPLLDKPLVEAPAEWLWQALEETESEGPAQPRDPQPPFVTPAELLTHLGDIVISWPTVQRQATGHDVAYELLFLLCHGVLHLVGYDDQTEAGYNKMVRIQQTILAELGREG